MGRLERKGVRLELFSDASLGNVVEGILQIKFVIRLVDGGGGRCSLAWKSKIGKRVAKSIIETDTINLRETLGMTVFLRGVIGR